MSDLSFRQQVIISVVEKGIIGISVLLVGFLLNVRLQGLKTTHDLALQADRNKATLEAEAVRERQRAEKERIDQYREDARAAKVERDELAKEQREREFKIRQEQHQFEARMKELEADFGQQLAHDRDTRRLNYLASQLAEFYWPLYLRLKVDDVSWEQAGKKYTGTPLEQSLAHTLERDLLLPNQEAAVSLIESHLYLVKPDAELLDVLTKYVKHVGVHRALRSSGIKEDPSYFKVPYPPEAVKVVGARLEKLQAEYQGELDKAQRATLSKTAIATSFTR